ncbi:MAG: alpha/beta hydrolase [Acidimicrobiales bacterium]
MSDDMGQGAVAVTRLAVATADGLDLRAELAVPGGATPRAGVVVCHPHPLHGGSMYNNVVEALFDGLPPLGAAVLRFNFRGTSGSEGRHDHGRGERLDVTAALDEMAGRWPGMPLLLAGYSFGADVSLAVDHPAVAGWLAVAPVLRVVDPAEMVALRDRRPVWLASAEGDQFRPYADLVPMVADAVTTTVTPVPGADHFFMVGLDRVVAVGSEALDAIAPRPTGS